METRKIGEKLRGLLVKPTAVLAGVGSLALLSGCGEPEILPNRPATVIEHQYDDPDTYLISVKPIMYGHDPEHFLLVLRQCDQRNDDFADNQGCVTDTVEVTQATYDAYPDGSKITLAPEK